MKEIIPPLGWKKVKLREVATFGSGSTPPRAMEAHYFSDNGTHWVKTTDLTNGKITSTEEKISSAALNETACKVFPPGTVLVAMYGGFRQIGRTGLLAIPAATNQAITAIQLTETDISHRFVQLWLNGLVHLWRRFAASSRKDPNITKDDVASFPILLPPYSEQLRICDTANAWDRAIDLAEHLLAEKRLRRQGLMQQLLTGKRRLPGFNASFKTVKFKDIVTPVQRQVPRPTQPYDALGIRCHCKGTFAKQVEDPEKVDMDMLFVAKAGDLIVNITFAWEGAIAIVPPEHDGRLVSHRFPTYRPNEQMVATEYLRYLITQEKFRYLLADISPGGAGRNRVMSKKDFLELQVSIPDLAEQRKVAEILDTASRELDLLQAKADALREQKKGLMQQLLTGKKRVKM